MHGQEETNMNLKRPNSIMPTPARYTGPLEYLTMWMCLFLSPAVLERLRDLQAQEPDWACLRGLRVKLSAAQAIHPHVLDVLQGMRTHSTKQSNHHEARQANLAHDVCVGASPKSRET